MSVVVDFGSLGGGDQSRCAGGDPASGVAALRGAGFEPTRAAQEPGYFVCRIDGKPASDPCQRTSPADAYWSYWHAEPGGSWTYSNAGPADHDPKPGTVEGWAFGAGDPPSTRPPAKAAPRTTAAAAPKPAASPKKAAPPAPRQPVAAATQSSPTKAAVAAAPTLSAAPTASRTAVPSARPSPSPSTTSVAVSAAPLAVEPPAPVDDGAGSRSGLVVAALVLGGLGAAAFRQVRLRR